MARVVINVFTTLKEAIGTGRVEVEGNNVGDLLDELARRFGQRFRNELYDGDKIKEYFILLLNGRVVDKKQIQSTVVKDGDVMHIFPPIAGG